MEAHNLSCIICLDPFTVPVTVPCGHTFCRDCITACPESQRVPCRFTTVEEGGGGGNMYGD
uniref:RING-type domain-containing protein n=1 Tax=Salmo trutta TaxID=8032 RepID=A0A673XS54_SALTR